MAVCQAHPDRVAVAPEGDPEPFLCADPCALACTDCNEMSRPDECAQDQEGGDQCSFAKDERRSEEATRRRGYERRYNRVDDTPSLEDHPMYDHVHNRNPWFPGEGY